MEWLARSAEPRKNQLAQTYARHVLGVRALLERFVQEISPLLPPTFLYGLRSVIFPAGEFHDLGKLDDENQVVLCGERAARNLPIVHSDAGVVELVGQERIIGALLIASHHLGLPNLIGEQNRGEDFLRVDESNGRARRMKGPLEVLVDRHRESLGIDMRTLDAWWGLWCSWW